MLLCLYLSKLSKPLILRDHYGNLILRLYYCKYYVIVSNSGRDSFRQWPRQCQIVAEIVSDSKQ